MVSRTSITLYSGLLPFLVTLGLTCRSVVKFGQSITLIHGLKDGYLDDSLSIIGSFFERYVTYDSYDELIGHFNNAMAFLVLLLLFLVAWVVTALVYIIKFEGDIRKATLFSILFIATLTAISIFGMASFALIGTALGGVYVEEAAMIAFWALSVIFGLATCVTLYIDSRKAVITNYNNNMTQAGKTKV